MDSLKKRINKKEAAQAKRLGMKTTKASGAFTRKGDMQALDSFKHANILLEAKFNENGKPMLEADWFHKLQKQAIENNAFMPVLSYEWDGRCTYFLFKDDYLAYGHLWQDSNRGMGITTAAKKLHTASTQAIVWGTQINFPEGLKVVAISEADYLRMKAEIEAERA